MDNLQAQIDILTENKAKLTKELGSINDEIKRLKEEIAHRDYGVKPGVLVIYKNEQYKITSIDARWKGRPWIYGVKRNKGGDWSKRSCHLFGPWELCDEQ